MRLWKVQVWTFDGEGDGATVDVKAQHAARAVTEALRQLGMIGELLDTVSYIQVECVKPSVKQEEPAKAA